MSTTKNLRMSPPIVDIHPTSRGSIFKLFPTSQLDYSKKQKEQKISMISIIRPLTPIG